MLVPLPVSIREMEKIQKERTFIGLISIPVLIVVFVSKFAPSLTPSFLRREQIFKLLVDG
jgi:hypothetical protein